MITALDSLILLGFICQGLSWERYTLVGANVILWIAAVTLRQRNIRLGAVAEIGLLLAGSASGYLAGRALGENTHFFIGEGIAWLQAGRMVRPQDAREKVFSVTLALLQFGAACTYLLDIRFLAVLTAAVALVPRCLMSLAGPPGTAAVRKPVAVGWGGYTAIAAAMAGWFVLVPRPYVGAMFQTEGFGGASATFGNFLDMSRSSLAQSGRVLMKIDGQQVGYLRSYCLVDFDGLTWTGRRKDSLRPLDRMEIRSARKRRVRVTSPLSLGKVLPTDGAVTGISGTFFRRPFQNRDSVIECESLWNAGNNIYVYWLAPTSRVERLSKTEFERLTEYPAVLGKIRAWLDQLFAADQDPLIRARHLEKYFQTHFTYRLGGPELSRVSPLEDFLFREREGHCERFASALAVLLRMEGIPSRVVLGFLPRPGGSFNRGYVVRFRDAHAWVEGYMPGRGWVTFDGTPPSSENWGSGIAGWLDEIDLFWSMNVSTFDRATQSAILGELAAVSSKAAVWTEGRSGVLGIGVAALAGLILAGRWWRYPRHAAARAPRVAEMFYAGDLYGKMLRLLASHGFHKSSAQTPLEFYGEVQTARFLATGEVGKITAFFCQERYGAKALLPDELAAAEEAFVRLAEAKVEYRNPKSETNPNFGSLE